MQNDTNEEEFWINDKNSKIGFVQDELYKKTNSKTFCILPWIHFATRPNGDMRLCCSANASGAGQDHTIGLVKNNNGKPANFGKESPLSAWNNEYMKSVRKTMLDGKIPASCKKCFAEESKGIASKRIWESYTWMNDGVNVEQLVKETKDDGTIPDNLVYLDLRLGHTCNLKCVMCSPHDSSLWVKDYYKLKKLTDEQEILNQFSWNRKDFNNFWHENPEFWREMYKQIPNLKQVYFAGGEPLMIKEHKMFIEEILRQGYQDNILLRYNSNGLLVDDEIIELWKKFKKVKFAVSLDAYGDKNFYIRYPSEWETIEKNLWKLDNTPENIQTSIATAIQILNIKHLPDFIKWKVKSKFKKLNTGLVPGNVQMGGGLINMHLLYIPTFLSIRILPESDKKEISESWKEFKDWLWNNYRKDSDFWDTNPYGWKRWQGIIDFLNSEDQSKLLPTFKNYIRHLDKIRNTDAKQYFPELTHLM
jgi:sulfatase maturation enzyme AslB (radical SAM superfamily)